MFLKFLAKTHTPSVISMSAYSSAPLCSATFVCKEADVEGKSESPHFNWLLLHVCGRTHTHTQAFTLHNLAALSNWQLSDGQ